MRRHLAGLLAVLVGCGGSGPVEPLPELLRTPRPVLLSPSDVCRPGSDRTHWVLEDDPLELTVGCTLPHTLEDDALQLARLPPGASWDPASRTFTWRPALDQAGLWHVPVEVPSLGERGYLRIGVVERWGAEGNVPIRFPEAYPEEYGLPVVHLFRDGGLSEEYGDARLVYRGASMDVLLKYRGNQSLRYPKKSFTVKLETGLLFEPHFAGGFARKKFVLTNNFDDASYVRQRLAYDLWNRLDPEHVPVKTFSAVVYLKGHPWGLYTLGDHVDRHLLRPNGIDHDANIYKAIRTSANFRVTRPDGRPKLWVWQGLVKKEGKPDTYDDLETFIRTVDLASDEELYDWLTSHVRLEDFANWWVLSQVGHTVDSVHKNVYLLHDPAKGPWRCVPWDFNASFGQDWKAVPLPPDVDQSFGAFNELFRRLLATPAYGLRARLDEALDGPLALHEVLSLVDGYEAEIDAGARRDWARWGRLHRTFFDRPDADYERELAYVRAWIAGRWEVLKARRATP